MMRISTCPNFLSVCLQDTALPNRKGKRLTFILRLAFGFRFLLGVRFFLSFFTPFLNLCFCVVAAFSRTNVFSMFRWESSCFPGSQRSGHRFALFESRQLLILSLQVFCVASATTGAILPGKSFLI